MRLIYKILAVSFIGVSLFSIANISFAQTPPQFKVNPATPPGTTGTVNDPTNSKFQLVTCTGVKENPNDLPECNYEQLIATASRILTFVLYMLIPIVLGMILFVGFKYITANGDSGKLADAKRMIIPLLTGIFFIFAAWLIVYTLLNYLLAQDVSGIDKSKIVPESITK
jgi:hypothetical protein